MTRVVDAEVIPDYDRWARAIPTIDHLTPADIMRALDQLWRDAIASGVDQERALQGVYERVGDIFAWADDYDASGIALMPGVAARARADVLRMGRQVYGAMTSAVGGIDAPSPVRGGVDLVRTGLELAGLWMIGRWLTSRF